jgi:uncharacterized glyoxalase superfamily protein PhnB
MGKAFEIGGVTASLSYEDAGAMLDWLTRVVGLRERARYVDKDGVVRQAELHAGPTEFWLNGHGPGYWAKLGRKAEGGIVVWVDDVDAHHAYVVAAGVDAPAPKDHDWGARGYTIRDPEGYWWSFLKRLERGYIQTKSLEDGGWMEELPAA